MRARQRVRSKREAAGDGLAVRRAVEPAIKGDEFRTGYVAIVGRPNVGKSTLLNQLLGQKIAATTHKPQTTRKNVLGILHPEGAQLLLLDTPGFHQAEGPLNRFMVKQAKTAISEADVIAYVVEARPDGQVTPGNEVLTELLAQQDKPVVLLLNKVDRVKDKEQLLFQLDAYRQALGARLTAAVPISAMKKLGLEEAVRELGRALPVGPAQFAEDELTDQSERSIVAELIREKLILETHEELPYAAAVTVDAFEDLRPRLVRVFATVHVEKESQKPIVIGRRAARIKTIGSRARAEVEHLLGSKVYLDLNVRVTEDWSRRALALSLLGVEEPAAGAPAPLDLAEVVAPPEGEP